MPEPQIRNRRRWPLLGAVLCAGVFLGGCGQRGPLYMPDRNARVVTRPASSAAAASSAPSSAPRQQP